MFLYLCFYLVLFETVDQSLVCISSLTQIFTRLQESSYYHDHHNHDLHYNFNMVTDFIQNQNLCENSSFALRVLPPRVGLRRTLHAWDQLAKLGMVMTLMGMVIMVVIMIVLRRVATMALMEMVMMILVLRRVATMVRVMKVMEDVATFMIQLLMLSLLLRSTSLCVARRVLGAPT